MAPSSFQIKLEPMGRSVAGNAGESLMEVAQRENLPVRSDCGGQGICGKCVLVVDPPNHASPPTDVELEALSPALLADNHRLACQTRLQAPATVTIPAQFTDTRAARGKSGISGTYEPDPLVKRLFLPKASSTEAENPAEDMAGWLSHRAQAATGKEIQIVAPRVFRQLSLPKTLRDGITLVHHEKQGVTAVIPGDAPGGLGLAVDIGTTTLAAYLCDLETGRVIASRALANPQRRFGEDVISRIAFANKEAGNLDTLCKLVAEAITTLAESCVQQVQAPLSQIDEVAIVGNPTMSHLFCGIHPHCLGVSPYRPFTREPIALGAGDAGLAGLNPGTPVYVFPVISGFIGGDTVGAILADNLHQRDEMSLIVDIGTNGELVMGNRDGLWAASCATGPAFEGAMISCGIRAVPGAVCKIDMDGDSGRIVYEMVGDEDNIRPMGLCGSGVIDAVATLRRAGIIRENGRLREDAPGVISDENGIGREFILIPAEESGTGSPLSITLSDIRQIQLAKAALAVGIDYLARYANRRVERTILTGAFGARFNWRNAVAIGMIPDRVTRGQVLSMDNLAGVGAIKALVNRKERDQATDFCQKVKFVELANEPDFNHHLVEQMMFPPV